MHRFVLLLAALIGSANATVIYSNIANGSSGNLTVGNLSGTESDWANEFQTASGSAVTLTDVEVVLGQLTGSGNTVTALLYSNNAGVPNALLATIGTLTPPASPAVQTFTPSSTITLQASTQYWIILVDNNTGFFAGWQAAANATGTGVSGESHAFWSGAAWSNEPNSTFSTTVPEMQIDVGAAAPEPATFAMFGAALAALILFRRSRLATRR
jgi:hypothetical protein